MDEDETTDDESTGDEETVDDDSAADETEDEAGDADPSDDGGATGIVAVRDTVREQVPALIGHDLDGVTSLMREEDGWLATVELVERHSVPDTQDILGQYEVTLAEDGSIHGYRRLETYRRAEGPPYEG
nr:gas vesicle protein GvpO [Halogeometricum limi]